MIMTAEPFLPCSCLRCRCRLPLRYSPLNRTPHPRKGHSRISGSSEGVGDGMPGLVGLPEERVGLDGPRGGTPKYVPDLLWLSISTNT